MADNLEEIYCPACGKKMHKVFMDEQNLNLDVCLDGCGGIYFDNREFKKFDERNEDISPLVSAYEGKTFKKVDSVDKRVCPVCKAPMVKHFASSMHEIQVDDCYHCGGLFLDYSELDRIRAQYVSEQHRNADAIKELNYTVGSALDDLAVAHSNIKNQHILRRGFGGFIKNVVLNYNKK